MRSENNAETASSPIQVDPTSTIRRASDALRPAMFPRRSLDSSSLRLTALGHNPRVSHGKLAASCERHNASKRVHLTKYQLPLVSRELKR